MLRSLTMCVGLACAGAALAQPSPGTPPPTGAPPAPAAVAPQAPHEAAEAQLAGGNPEKAAELVEQGLNNTPRDGKLNALKRKLERVLLDKGKERFEQRDYLGALEAYEACLRVATLANRRVVEKIIKDLAPARTTSIEITVTNGPADIYVDSRTLGVVCKAASSCKKAWLPGNYDVFAETQRPGFKPWAGAVSVQNGQAAKLSITLDQEPSQLTVRVTPPDARVTVDGAPHDASRPLPAGKHKVVVSLDDHKAETREVVAREGKPIELSVELKRIPPPTIVAQPAPPSRGGITGRRKIALAAGGVGVVALGTAIVLGLQAKGLDDDSYKLCGSPDVPCLDALEANDLNDRARSRAVGANIAFGIAGGAAIAAGVLWLTGGPAAPESRQVTVTPRLGAVTGLDVALRF